MGLGGQRPPMRPYESSSVGQGSARRNALDPSAQSRAIAGRRHPQRTGGVDPNDRPGLAEGHPLDQPSGRVNRRARLEDVVANDLVFTVRWLVPDGLEAWKPVIVRGYEGYVAKDETSVYEGGRTRRWRRVKQKEWMVAEDGWRRRISVAQPAP